MSNISQSMVAETRPDPEQYTKAVEVFWHQPIAKLLDGKFDVGRNHSGIGFCATFRLLRGKMQLTLTPERRSKNDEAGEAFTHLCSMRWLTAAWQLRRRTQEGQKFTPTASQLLAA